MTAKIRSGKAPGAGQIDRSAIFDKLILWLGAVFVFMMPLKYGLPNLDVLATQVSNTISFTDVIEQWPEELAQVFILLLAFLWGAKCIFEKRLALRYTRMDIFLWGFIAAVVISTAVSVVKHSSLIGLSQFLSYVFLYYFLLNNFHDRNRRRTLITAFLAAVVFITAIGFYQYFVGFRMTLPEVQRTIPKEQQGTYMAIIAARRVTSTFVYPNVLAGFLLLAIPPGFCYMFARKKWLGQRETAWQFVLIALALAASITCFILTKSKGGYICFAISGLLGLIILWRRLNLGRRWLVLLLAVLIIAAAGFVHTPQGRYLVRRGAYTFSERISYWQGGLKMMKRAPVTGNGLNSFKDLYPLYKPLMAKPARNAHNNYLQLAIEIGIPGAIFFIMFWLGIVAAAGKKAFSRREDQNQADKGDLIVAGGFLALIGFLLHNIVDFDLYVPSIAMTAWFMAAMIIPGCGIARIVNIKLKSSGRQLAVFLAILIICGGGIYWATRMLKARVSFAAAEDFIYGRVEGGSTWMGTEELKRGLKLDPFNHNYHLLLGRVYFEEGLHHRAFDSLKKAKKLSPLSHRIQFSMAVAKFRKFIVPSENAWDQFLSDLETTLELYPSSPFYRFIYFSYLDRAGRREQAEEQLISAIALDPGLERTLHRIKVNYNDPEVVAAAEDLWVLLKLLSLGPVRVF